MFSFSAAKLGISSQVREALSSKCFQQPDLSQHIFSLSHAKGRKVYFPLDPIHLPISIIKVEKKHFVGMVVGGQ